MNKFVLSLIISVFCILFIISCGKDPTIGWKLTNGKIITSNITKISSKRGGANYRLDIEYEYTVNKKVYRSNRIKMGSNNLHYGHEFDVHSSNLSKADKVDVYYDENDPSQSVLEQGYDYDNELEIFKYIMIGIFAVFFVIVNKKLIKKKA
jgi:hypothetical protein